MAEPSRIGIYVAVKKNPPASGGSTTRCVTVYNKNCNKPLYFSVGLPNSMTSSGVTYPRWFSQGWWSAPAYGSKQLCWTGITDFYL